MSEDHPLQRFNPYMCLVRPVVLSSQSNLLFFLQVKCGPSSRAVRTPEDILVERNVLEDWHSGIAFNQTMAKFETPLPFLHAIILLIGYARLAG